MFAKIYAVLAAFASAMRAAAAVEAHAAPNPRDLVRLGINPGVFGAINRA